MTGEALAIVLPLAAIALGAASAAIAWQRSGIRLGYSEPDSERSASYTPQTLGVFLSGC